ncbi:MAG: SEL1-like repeat protein [Ruminococcus sp.]|nr:SEL1-like repeat protein [Ruminococcus sp.]
MPTSQIIVSSRYIKSGTKKTKTKRANFTKYIATRESVVKRPQSNAPVTKNQTQLINDLLVEFPKAKLFLEYEDYAANPTAENASELISTIIERYADVLGNRRNFVGYMAMRPGAEKREAHGLFNDSDEPIDLNAVADEVANHPGNIWTHVVSLRREDAVRLGYTNSDMWRELVKRHISDIAQAQNIPLANLKWYAAFHNTTHHPHIHLIVYSINPKQGYLTKQGIEKIRSVFANDIFHDDLKSIYQQQTLTRDELKALSENQMKEILSQIGTGVVDEELVKVIEKLHGQLKTAKGKKVYGYLPKEVKQTVDEIFSMLADDEHIKQLYEKWCELESLKYKTYTLKPKTFQPLTENKVFRSVKNMIIRIVLEMDKPFSEGYAPAPPEPTDTDDDTDSPINYGDELSPDDFIFDSTDAVEVDVSDFTPPSKYTLKWSDDYKSACKLIYDKHSKSEDYKEAEKLLLSEAAKGNALAIHDLGKLYATDKLGAKDEDKSAQFYAEALVAFMDIEPNADFMFPYESKSAKPKDMRSYIWYRIGKMHCYGLGTEQNYAEAFRWFEKSATEGNKFAQFSLANLYYYGNGVEQNYNEAFHWYMSAAKQGQPYAAFAMAQMYANGESVDKDEMQAQVYDILALFLCISYRLISSAAFVLNTAYYKV